jgi:hypothetical protein
MILEIADGTKHVIGHIIREFRSNDGKGFQRLRILTSRQHATQNLKLLRVSTGIEQLLP